MSEINGVAHCEACVKGEPHELTPTCQVSRVTPSSAGVILTQDEYAYLTDMRKDLETLKAGVLAILALVTGAGVPPAQIEAVIRRLGGELSRVVRPG